MDDDRIKVILDGNVGEVKASLVELPAADLAALRVAELAAENPRSTVIDAIERREAELAEIEQAGSKAQSAKPAASAATAKPWQADDYDGPLTGEQAAWRRENTKPARKVTTK